MRRSSKIGIGQKYIFIIWTVRQSRLTLTCSSLWTNTTFLENSFAVGRHFQHQFLGESMLLNLATCWAMLSIITGFVSFLQNAVFLKGITFFKMFSTNILCILSSNSDSSACLFSQSFLNTSLKYSIWYKHRFSIRYLVSVFCDGVEVTYLQKSPITHVFETVFEREPPNSGQFRIFWKIC